MTLAKPFDRITIEPEKMAGKPCIRGYRFTVRNLLGYLGTYPHRADLFAAFPFLEEEDVQQALAFAAEMMDPTWIAPGMPLDIAS